MSAIAKSGAKSAPRQLVPVLFIGVFMAALDTAVIGPAIPVLRETFGVDNRQVGLVMSVFVLFSLCSTALMANLSDRYGRRPVYLASVALFALGSLFIAASSSFWMLVASRAVQGIGAGGITPTASAVVGDVFAPEQRGKMLGLIGATYGMAFVIGPPLAAILMVVLSWHWIFLLNLPIAVAILYLGARVLPAARAQREQLPLDLPGIGVTFAMLGTLVLGLTRVLDRLTGLLIWPYLLAAAALLLVLVVWVENRARQPLVPMALFKNRQLSLVYFLALGAGFGMGSVIFLTSIANLAYQVNVKSAGFVLLPLVICSMLGSMGAGRAMNVLGERLITGMGFALLGVGYGVLSITSMGLWLFLLASMPVGLGIGIVVGGALRSIAIDEAPPAVRAAAQGLINIFTAIGTLLSAAAVSVMADWGGGGAAGFGRAYVMVAVVMLVMLVAAYALRGKVSASEQIEPV